MDENGDDGDNLRNRLVLAISFRSQHQMREAASRRSPVMASSRATTITTIQA